MADAWYISSDSHMSEPLDLWTTRMDAKFRDRAPHVEDEYNGVPGAWWVYEGYEPHDLAVGVAGGQEPHRGREGRVHEDGRVRRCASRRVGPGGAAEGHGRRRRGRRGAVHDAGLPAVLAAGPGAATRVLPRLQRLAGRVLQLRARPAEGAGAGIPLRPRTRRGGAGAVREDGAERRDDLGVPARGPAVPPGDVRRLLEQGGGARDARQPPPADRHGAAEVRVRAGEPGAAADHRGARGAEVARGHHRVRGAGALPHAPGHLRRVRPRLGALLARPGGQHGGARLEQARAASRLRSA